MDIKPVKSEMATHVGFDPATGVLEVHIKGTKQMIYRYSGVHPDTFALIEKAESFGKAFREHILKSKIRYDFTKEPKDGGENAGNTGSQAQPHGNEGGAAIQT